MRPIRVFLVEDNPGDVYLIKLAIAEQGIECEYEEATDGRAALEAVRAARARPDIAVVDLNLPMHSGREVLQAIRASQRWREVPVLILTSSSSPTDRFTLQELGATRYLQKPSDLDDFLAIGRKVVEMAGRIDDPPPRA